MGTNQARFKKFSIESLFEIPVLLNEVRQAGARAANCALLLIDLPSPSVTTGLMS
ncbi:MAG: hypothetical protein ACRC1H_03675 [Caldilineaceae bacterium]